MYLADYHTHSRVSPDAGHSMEEIAAAGVRAGLEELCFTDHVEPIRWGTLQVEAHDYYDDPSPWFNSLELLAKEVAPRVKLPEALETA